MLFLHSVGTASQILPILSPSLRNFWVFSSMGCIDSFSHLMIFTSPCNVQAFAHFLLILFASPLFDRYLYFCFCSLRHTFKRFKCFPSLYVTSKLPYCLRRPGQFTVSDVTLNPITYSSLAHFSLEAFPLTIHRSPRNIHRNLVHLPHSNSFLSPCSPCSSVAPKMLLRNSQLL